MNVVLIIGSSTDALRSRQWSRSNFTSIVAINNAWNIRDDWDYCVHAGDFPEERRPIAFPSSKKRITYDEYIPAQNVFGGVVYIGATMAMTTAYWVLHALKPDVMAFIGCDMVYPKDSKTHFYGQGAADPLRDDVTLQNLEAKSMRLQVHAAEHGCCCVNLTSLSESRLVFPKLSFESLFENSFKSILSLQESFEKSYDSKKVLQAKNRERKLNYFVESGEYWNYLNTLDAQELYELDQLWLSVCE